MIVKKVNLPMNFEDDYWQENFHDLRNMIYYNVGGGTVKVEAHVNHYNLSIYQAVKKYYENENLHIETIMLSLDANKEAELSDEIERDLINDVLFFGHGATFSQFQMSNAIYDSFFMRDFANPIISGTDISQYVMARQKLKDIDKVIGTDRTWEIKGNRIVCYPKGMHETNIGVVYGHLLLPEQLESDGWIQDYAMAHFKHILGTNRRKFTGFQTSAGAATTDGADLITEAQVEKEKLMEELKARKVPLPILKL